MAVTINGSTGVQLDDNDKQKFGTGDDLEIFHNGNHSIIADVGTGNLQIRADDFRLTDSTNAEVMMKANTDGAVELYYDHVKTFQTDGNGMVVYGPEGGNAEIKIYADEGDDNADLWKMSAFTDGSFRIQNYADGAWENSIIANGGGNTKLFYNNSEKLETKTDGISVTGTVQASYGSGQYGAQINHDQTTGTHIQFQRQGYNNGNITHDTNNSAYNTSGSDRTLKKNFEDWTDSYWTAFKNLNPQKFHFLTDDDSDPKCRGYIAQDLVATFPEAYPKEVVSDKYMFNPSGMVPYLMKTLKEALIEIDTLKTKVAALEAHTHE